MVALGDASSVPSDWEDVSASWMTAALQRRCPGVVVAGVTVISRDDGTNRRARLGITYAPDSSGEGPEVVFVKGEGAFREAHAKNGNMFNEPELFAAEVPLPVDHPLSYHVAIDRPGLDYAVVMEDVTRRGAVPRDATMPMTVAQADDAVRQLARLHGAYWHLEPDRHPGLGWLQTWAASPGWGETLGASMVVGLSRCPELLPPQVAARPTDQLTRDALRSIGSYGLGDLTLLHGDAHIGNTYVLPGDRVGFLDWQCSRRGNWAMDLGYFLVSALTVDDRRKHEELLFAAYRAELGEHVADAPSADEVRQRCAAGHAYGLVVWLATHRTDLSQSPAVCRALIERYAAAYADHDTPGALTELGI